MTFAPIVVELPTPVHGNSWRNKIPRLSVRGTKILIAAASAVMILSMASFAYFSIQSNNQTFSEKHGLDANLTQTNGLQKSSTALPGGSVATGIGGTHGQNAPVITLTADPATVQQGQTSKLKWSVTNKPLSCVASDDWSGSKSTTGGEEPTPTLTKTQNYLFTLTCKTATGTGFMTVAVSVTTPNNNTSTASTSTATGKPSVTIAASPALVFAGDSATIRWDATGNPTSCTASGDWSGIKAASGTESTGKLTVVKQYTYTVVCKNAVGTSDSKSAYLTVQTPPPDTPAVVMSSSNSGPITPGTPITLQWSSTNNPTSCTASGDWSGAKATNGSQLITGLTTIKTYQFTLMCSNSAGSTLESAVVQVLPPQPTVALTVSPSSIYIGNAATLSWTTGGTPTSCTATGDWSGVKANSGGSQSTGTINVARTYNYSISCTNAAGTAYANNIPLTVTIPPVPVVSLNANPISVTLGGSSNLTWSATNSPTSCTASGSWSGAKASNGTASTGTLSTVKTYSYTLSCSNAGGSGSATTSVSVSSGTTTNPPVVAISASPQSIGTGSSSVLTWSATNSPTSCTAGGSWSGSKAAAGSQSTGVISTAGTYTYSLSCTNSAGTNSASITVTAIATPTINISVSPVSISAGSSATLTWTAGNSPTSCTAGGSWSGSKAAAGSQSTGVISTAGTYTYSLSCTNTGGTVTASTTLNVTPVVVVYCSGQTPCYGPNDLGTHITLADCWAYNTSIASSTNISVYNITSFNSGFHSSRANLLASSATASALCGAKELGGYLSGTTLSGVGSHNHTTATKQNANSTLLSYRVGFYDASKP